MFEFIAITWFLTVGWVPQLDERVAYYDAKLDPDRVATVAELGFSADVFDRATFSASMQSYQYMNLPKLKGFTPFRIDYKAAVQFRVTENISLAFEHECDHTVATNSATHYGSNETIISVTYRSR